MESRDFTEKLNRIEGKTYVIEEEIQMPESGIYEGLLSHDNINEVTLTVYTEPKLTGERILSFTLSTPSLTPWKRSIRIQSEAPAVYICYETNGDTVEAEDINRLQEVAVEIQADLKSEAERAKESEAQLRQTFAAHMEEENPHGVTAGMIGLGNVDNKSAEEILSGLRKENVVDALGYTPPETSSVYQHPESGVPEGTYKSVTVDAQGHVTAGDNPTTLAGYGITDAIKKGAVKWSDLGGG